MEPNGFIEAMRNLSLPEVTSVIEIPPSVLQQNWMENYFSSHRSLRLSHISHFISGKSETLPCRVGETSISK